MIDEFETLLTKIKDSLGSLENLLEAGNLADAKDEIFVIMRRLNALAKIIGEYDG